MAVLAGDPSRRLQLDIKSWTVLHAPDCSDLKSKKHHLSPMAAQKYSWKLCSAMIR